MRTSGRFSLSFPCRPHITGQQRHPASRDAILLSRRKFLLAEIRVGNLPGAGTLEPWLAVNGTSGCERAISEESSKGKVASKAVTSALLYQGYLKPGGSSERRRATRFRLRHRLSLEHDSDCPLSYFPASSFRYALLRVLFFLAISSSVG